MSWTVLTSVDLSHNVPGEGPPLDDGYIEASKPREEVRQEPYPLPKDFEWATLDINDPKQVCSNFVLSQSQYRYMKLSRTRKFMICSPSTMLKTTLHHSDSNTVRNSSHGTYITPHVLFRRTYDIVRALKPPGYFKEWHVGVRVSSNKKLVAFISGVPITIRVRGKSVHPFLPNFLYFTKSILVSV